MIKCKKCGYSGESESEIELHHILPKFMGGEDKDGRVYLCKKHHGILHNTIPSIIWKFVKDKEKCKEEIKYFTFRFLK